MSHNNLYGSFYRLRSACFHQVQLIRFLREYLPKQRAMWMRDARKRIQLIDELDPTEKEKLFLCFADDYDRYRAKFMEYYYGYDFPHLNNREKKTFLLMRELQIVLEKLHYLHPQQRPITSNKQLFLHEYHDFIHRDYLLVTEESEKTSIQSFLDSYDTIVKPTDSCGGKGVLKINRGQGRAEDILAGRLPALLEECVYNIPELAAFHPASLNTVRVTTIANGKDVKFFGAVLRTGNNNSVFDNADAGGVFAEIDVNSGKVISDGVTEKGEVFSCHPFSNVPIKGTQIPRWPEVLEVCSHAALHNPDTYIVAWDIAIISTGVEIIEGNSLPSIEIHQIPLQEGKRKRFFSQLRQLRIPYLDVLVLTWCVDKEIKIESIIRAVKKAPGIRGKLGVFRFYQKLHEWKEKHK